MGIFPSKSFFAESSICLCVVYFFHLCSYELSPFIFSPASTIEINPALFSSFLIFLVGDIASYCPSPLHRWLFRVFPALHSASHAALTTPASTSSFL